MEPHLWFVDKKNTDKKEEKPEDKRLVVVYLVVLNACELLDESTQCLSFSLRLIARGQLGPVALSVKKTQQINHALCV